MEMRLSDRTTRSSEDRVADFQHRCSWLLTSYGSNPRVERALAGLYYAVKSTRIAPRIVDALVSGCADEVIASGSGEDACYVAESMVRSVHSAGDLLAQVVNECVCLPPVDPRSASLKNILKHVGDAASRCGGTADGDWYSAVAQGLRALQDSPDYVYVEDFTNTVKHRQYIDRALLTTDDGCRVVFYGFAKDKRTHAAKTFGEVCSIADRVVGACLEVVEMVEARKSYDNVIAAGGTIVGDFVNLSATPSVMTPDQFLLQPYVPRAAVEDGD